MISLKEMAEALPDRYDFVNVEEAWTDAIKTVEASFVPRVTSERPCEEKDFSDYKSSVEVNFKWLKILLFATKEKQESDHNMKINNDFLLSLLLLCSEHNSLNHWSNTETVRLAKEILVVFCQLHSCSTIGEYLMGSKTKLGLGKDNENYSPTSDKFNIVLMRLRPKLLKETWKHYPSAVAGFQWLLYQVKFPFLNFERHGMVFTTSLIIVDDYVLENKIIGTKCLQHYMDNITKTDFCANGRDVVIYDALFINLYSQEPAILECLLPCMLTTLKKMKPMITTPDADLTPYVYRWEKFDDVLDKILSAMLMDRNIEVRMVYVKWLPSIIEARGIRVVVFTKQMITVLENYMETLGPSSAALIKLTLNVFLVLMKNIIPRLHAHALQIFLILLKKLYDFTSHPDSSHIEADSAEMIQLIGENVKFLIQSCPEKFTEFSVEYINSLRLNEVGVSTLMSACELKL